MPERIVFRAATDGDAEPLAAFLNVCTLTYQGVARSSPADARAGLYEHGADPSSDSRLAFSGDEIVGFARVWPASEEELRFFARTHPEATGRGVASALLECCEGRARELSPDRSHELTTMSWAEDDRAPDLLEAHGFSPVRYFLQMRIAAQKIPPEGRWPAGVTVEPFSAGTVDDDALYRAWRDAFAD